MTLMWKTCVEWSGHNMRLGNFKTMDGTPLGLLESTVMWIKQLLLIEG